MNALNLVLPMDVIPAIDLRGGRCVRLQQGDYARETVFSTDPAALARRWLDEGASRLHLVDLDGARSGRADNQDAVRAILRTVDIPCQLGGGIRSTECAIAWLEAGVDRVIVGTQALKDPDWFAALLEQFPRRILLGLDARDGLVATDGWLDVSSVPALELARRFDRLPLAAIIYTDIARDGMLAGPNLETTSQLSHELETPLIASGGVGTLQDIRHLAAIPVSGCIVGRALYEERFRLAEAIDAARSSRPPPHLQP